MLRKKASRIWDHISKKPPPSSTSMPSTSSNHQAIPAPLHNSASSSLHRRTILPPSLPEHQLLAEPLFDDRFLSADNHSLATISKPPDALNEDCLLQCDMASIVSIKSLGRPKIVNVVPRRSSSRRHGLEICPVPFSRHGASESASSTASSEPASEPPSPARLPWGRSLPATKTLRSRPSESSLDSYKNFSHKIRIMDDASHASTDRSEPTSPHYTQFASFPMSAKFMRDGRNSANIRRYTMPSPTISEKDHLSDSDCNFYESDSADGLDMDSDITTPGSLGQSVHSLLWLHFDQKRSLDFDLDLDFNHNDLDHGLLRL